MRVGTHALNRTSSTTLWGRLRQHRARIGGRNPGGGNHRASIFRRHVGNALIRRDGQPDGLLESWASNQRHPQWAALEDQLERAVSPHIGAMPVLWLAVPSHPDGSSDRGRIERGRIERNTIALLSCATSGPDEPSRNWLGHQATSTKVRQSGLWNSNHVDEAYDPAFLHLLADLVNHAP